MRAVYACFIAQGSGISVAAGRLWDRGCGRGPVAARHQAQEIEAKFRKLVVAHS